MGYTYRNNGQITDFTPDNDANTLYVRSSDCVSMSDLYIMAQDHFGEDAMDDLQIRSEKIHVYCLTYDQYDPSDYADFIVIAKT